jgi:putative ABC transport system permease protein
MRAIHRKLFRDLWLSRGQVLAIALVIFAGIAMFIAYFSVFESLDRTLHAYYERYRFADVFAGAKRAPNWLEPRLRAIPGVAEAETRVVVAVNLDLPTFAEPISGLLISIPARDEVTLNDVAIQRGRYPEPDRPDEVLVSEGFALAHRLDPGAKVAAIINGTRRDLRIVGIALSPEYVYVIRPGELMPDESRYGLFWMQRRALASAFDMEGGFNDVALRLHPGASAKEAIQHLDRLLAPYGGRGSIPRAQQVSHWTLNNELVSLRAAGFVIPSIFLAIAAFLLHITLGRLVAVQREQIAALKALGYANSEVGTHYWFFGLAIALLGFLLGLWAGSAMGGAMISMYNDFFRFPFLEYRLSHDVVFLALIVAIVFASVGAASAVRRAVRLPPAEAMRPEPPAHYRRTLLERLGLAQGVTEPTRIILRNLERRPGRALASIVGIAFAGAMMVVGIFPLDSIDELLYVQFGVSQRQDMTVNFIEPRGRQALYEVLRWPEVIHAEPMRAVATRLRHGQYSRETAITGLDPNARLQRVMDASLRPISLPPDGLVLSDKLAQVLGAVPGDVLTVEVLEGRRPVREVQVAAIVEEYLGMSVYMDHLALRRLLREGENLSAAYLEIDPRHQDELYRRIKAIPAVAAVALKDAAEKSFRDTIGQNMGVMVFFNVILAMVICFGVVYNAARITLSERSRELASLRVIGFTRGEISYILLGELAILTLIAIPTACVLGYLLSAWIVTLLDNELYRFPLIVATRTYGVAALVIVVAALFSGLTVRRKLDHLDLVSVLKTRE